MNTPSYPHFAQNTEVLPRRVLDVTWGRILFQPPRLNPRLVFDPLPFRTQTVTRPARNNRPAFER